MSYEARKFGVTRQMRGDEAKAKCPQIVLCRVPELRGKADLTRYRDACAEVMQVLQNFADICERASVDEAYLDLTDKVERFTSNTFFIKDTVFCDQTIILNFHNLNFLYKGNWKIQHWINWLK